MVLLAAGILGGCDLLRGPARRPLPHVPTTGRDTVVRTDTAGRPSVTVRRFARYDFAYLLEGAPTLRDRRSLRNADFFRGAVIAGQKLRSCGVALQMRLVSSADLVAGISDSTVVIGPFGIPDAGVTAACDRYQRVQLMSGRAVSYDTSVLTASHRVVFTAPAEVLGAAAARRAARRYSGWRVTLFQDRTDSAQAAYFQQWMKGFRQAAEEAGIAFDVRLLSPRDVSWRKIPLMLTPHMKDSQVVVVLGLNSEFVTGLLAYLVEKTTDIERAKVGKDTVLPVVAFGLPQWQNFPHADPEIWNRLGIEIVTPYYVDYARPDVQQFVRTFRKRYAAEPSIYAFMGFDVTYAAGLGIRERGYDFPPALSALPQRFLATGNRFQQVNGQGAWVNHHVMLLKFVHYRWRPLGGPL